MLTARIWVFKNSKGGGGKYPILPLSPVVYAVVDDRNPETDQRYRQKSTWRTSRSGAVPGNRPAERFLVTPCTCGGSTWFLRRRNTFAVKID